MEQTTSELRARHAYLLERYKSRTILPDELHELQALSRQLRLDYKPIDAIMEAVEQTGLLQDYQLSNLAEFLEGELRQKASRY